MTSTGRCGVPGCEKWAKPDKHGCCGEHYETWLAAMNATRPARTPWTGALAKLMAGAPGPDREAK